MVNYPLGFSVIEDVQKDNLKKKSSVQNKKTQKNRDAITKKRNTKVEAFLNSLKEDNENEDYETFKPDGNEKKTQNEYARPMSVYNEKLNENEKKNHSNTDDEYVGREEFNILQSNSNDDYYNSYIPYPDNTSSPQNISGQKDMLIEKLNYMIHLLEEQQEEKTGHVTEELILYSFLGVFVIFVVDSFARAGKYVR